MGHGGGRATDPDHRVRDAGRYVEELEAALASGGPRAVALMPPPAGVDATGTARCWLRPDGTVDRIWLDDDRWWTALGPQRVARGVLEAFRHAQEKAVLARLAVARAGGAAPAPGGHLPEPGASGLVGPLPPSDSPDFVDAVARRMDLVFATLDETRRTFRGLDERERDERAVPGPRGLFRVRLAGGRIVGACVDEYRLRREDGGELADDARAALAAVSGPRDRRDAGAR